MLRKTVGGLELSSAGRLAVCLLGMGSSPAHHKTEHRLVTWHMEGGGRSVINSGPFLAM